MTQLPFKGIMLVCDMDGTLLNSRNEVSKENSEALKRFTDGGGLFTIASGRTSNALKDFLDVLPVNTPAIIINGAQICDLISNRVYYRQALDNGVEALVSELLQSFPDMGIEIFAEKGVYVVRENGYTEEHRTRERMLDGTYPYGSVPKPWYKVVMAWDNEKLKSVELFLRDRIGASEQTVFSEWNLLDILHRDASKGRGLKELCGILSQPCEDVIAVGDNLNDMDMIIAAGTGIAVENALEELKKSASFCTVHHDCHAIAEVISWIEGKNKEGA